MLEGEILPPSNKLTEVKIKNIKPNGKIERFADGEGLYLETSVAGSKSWRMKYRVDGKEKRLSFGEWPAVYSGRVFLALTCPMLSVSPISSHIIPLPN